MRNLIALILCFFALSGLAYGMYGEDTEPSEADSQYMRDKEDAESVTLPERQTEMPEAMQDIRDEQKENPEEDFIEDNVTESERESL